MGLAVIASASRALNQILTAKGRLGKIVEMTLPNQFDELSSQLPSEVFQDFASLIAPDWFEDKQIVAQCTRDFRSASQWVEYWDAKLSTVFDFVSELINAHAAGCEQIFASITSNEPLFVYLRDFHLSRQPITYSEDSAGGMSYLKLIPMSTYNLHHMLAESALKKSANIVAVRHFAGLAESTSMVHYVALPSLVLNNGDWQDVVEMLIQAADGIMLHLGPLGPGTRMEIELIRKYQRQDSTVVAIERQPNDGQSDQSQMLKDVFGTILPPGFLQAPTQLDPATIGSVLGDFPIRYQYEANGLLVDRHLAIDNLLRLAGSRKHSVTVEQLQQNICRDLDLSRMYSNGAASGLENLAGQAEELAEKTSGTVRSIFAKYCEAACLTLLGRPDKGLYAFGAIAVMLQAFPMDENDGTDRVAKNIGRMAACLRWSGAESNHDVAIEKATDIFVETLRKLDR